MLVWLLPTGPGRQPRPPSLGRPRGAFCGPTGSWVGGRVLLGPCIFPPAHNPVEKLTGVFGRDEVDESSRLRCSLQGPLLHGRADLKFPRQRASATARLPGPQTIPHFSL
jgi:hypothetical protein